MSWLFATGHIVDLILALTLIEAILLTLWHRRTGGGLAPADLAGNLLAGVFLLLALRCALVGTPWICPATALTAAGLAHLADLHRRWGRRPEAMD